ncbi:MAG TPA: V-type ATP synthase subunit D [Gaiellaceae bacterium]|nr:V-type ATP synthase subunit D [Gaiellaceae bacterium]
MRLRIPAGRAGRLWLRRRLAVARRGHDVLEQKRQALRRQLERLDDLLGDARREWELRAVDAERWWQRAAVLAGERPLELAQGAVRGRAEVNIVWRNALGVVYPSEAAVALPAGEQFPSGGSAALAFAAEAHRRALEAAAELGAAELAHERTARELQMTTQRLRALERRWIPEHERVLREVELALDESDREEASRVRWVIRRLAPVENAARGRDGQISSRSSSRSRSRSTRRLTSSSM